MLCLITYRRLAQGIWHHRFLLLCHPSVLPSLHKFFFNIQNRKYTQSLIHCTMHKIFFQQVFICPNQTPNKRVTSILLRRWNLSWNFRICATLNVFSITPCTCLQIRWFLMCWNGNLMELLNILFSSFVHLWTSSQIDEDSSIHRGIWRGW
jgi:hypothetical protein